MAIKSLNPYLNFNGTAEKALKLYESALGAKILSTVRFSDAPGTQVPPEHQNRIMHAALNLGEGVIMVSDTMPDDAVGKDGNVWVSLNCDDVADMTKKFDALSVGGQVIAPLADTFWGAKFGMLTDAYGIRWMFSSEHKKA